MHSLEPGETPSAKLGEITTKFQFTGTGTQPHRNRKLIQFDYAHYCMASSQSYSSTMLFLKNIVLENDIFQTDACRQLFQGSHFVSQRSMG